MISVIVVTTGKRSTLDDCISSLLLQDYDYKDFEIIVVYPNKEPKIMLSNARTSFVEIVQDGEGIGNARNSGIAIAKGKIIVFTDDDCIVPKDWLQKISDKFNEHLSCRYIGGEFTMPKTNDIWLQWIDKRYHLSQSNIEAGLVHGNNMAFRREIFNKFKFDDTVNFGYDDADLELRLHSAGEKSNVFQDILVEHRHEEGFKAFNRMRLGYVKGRVHIYRKQGRELFTLLDLFNFAFVLSLFYSLLTFNPIIFTITLALFFIVSAKSCGVFYGWKFALIDLYSSFLWSFGKLYYTLGAKLK